MTDLTLFPPALILIFGALILPFLRGVALKAFTVILPAIAFYVITQLSPESAFNISFLGLDLVLLRVDSLAKVFGYIFTLSAGVAFIYGFYEKHVYQYIAALFYIGSALGVVFAGDLFSLYIFWEVMAVASTFLILARKTASSMSAAKRYILVHVFGGLVLLAGIVLHYSATGSLAFNGFELGTLSSALILVGFLVNAAAFPFSSWLPDAYPEATALGGVILSAYTSKTAVYAILRGFAGWDILIPIGVAMVIYGIVYAVLEGNIRRVLAFSIVNQVGFMVIAAGIGTPLAIAGAAAQAFCHILYKGLLWMTAGAVLHQTGHDTEDKVGGLARYMPWTASFAIIGALASLAVPFSAGYISKKLILGAVEYQHLFVLWLILELASAAVVLNSGIKFPHMTFFSKHNGLTPQEAPVSMRLAMGILAILCIGLGLFPSLLYDQLPYQSLIGKYLYPSFSKMYLSHLDSVVTKLQLLVFSAIGFFIFLPLIKTKKGITLDIDWFYRQGAKWLYKGVDKGLNAVNAFCNDIVVNRIPTALSKQFRHPALESCGNAPITGSIIATLSAIILFLILS